MEPLLLSLQITAALVTLIYIVALLILEFIDRDFNGFDSLHIKRSLLNQQIRRRA